jgi:transcriptional regulator with XRE-family HTH domain
MAAKVDESQNALYIEVGKRIKNARNKKNFSQNRLAEASSLSRTSITNIEKGRQHLPIHTLYAIANVLEINVAELLPDQNQSFDKVLLENVPKNLQKKELEWIHEVASTTTKNKKR